MGWTHGLNGMEKSKTAIDCVKTNLVAVGGEWRTSPSDAGAETDGGYSSEMTTVTGEGKQNSMTSIDASLTPDSGVKRRATT